MTTVSRYYGDGTTRIFAVPFDYISHSDVKVHINGETVDFVWISAGAVRLSYAPAANSLVTVRRATRRDEALVDFTDGSTLVSDALDISARQSRFLAEEALDLSRGAPQTDDKDGAYDFRLQRGKNLADPILPFDAVNKRWAETGMTSQLARAITAATQAQLSANLALNAIGSLTPDGGFPREQIPFRALSLLVGTFQVTGWATAGDGGCGWYVRDKTNGQGPVAIRDRTGVWWCLDLSRETPRLGMFGPIRTADETATIQKAIDTVAPYVWRGNATETNHDGHSGMIIVERGIHFYTRLDVNPSVRLVGESTPNDWSIRRVAITPISSADSERYGSALVCLLNSPREYSIDTSSYNAQGVRTRNLLVSGDDINEGRIAQVQGVCFENLAIIGSWKCSGLNLAGVAYLRMRNCFITGFTSAIRATAVLYASIEDTTIRTNYRGMIAWRATTDLTLRNVSILGAFDAPVYNHGPDMGIFEGTYRTTDPNGDGDSAWWTNRRCEWTVGLYNNYSNVTAYNLTIENLDCAFMNHNAKTIAHDVYVERINRAIVCSRGPDQQYEYYFFKTVVSNPTAEFIHCNEARLDVNYAYDNYLVPSNTNAYYKLYGEIVAPSLEFLPHVGGLIRTNADVYEGYSEWRTPKAIELQWTPRLEFGEVSAGPQPNNSGHGYQVGRLVFLTGFISLPEKSAAEGNLAIGGLPRRVKGDYNQHGGGVVSFAYLALEGNGGTVDAPPGGYTAYIRGRNHAQVSNGADVRFSLTYLTDEAVYP